ncbi:unnamed protein product, partial [Meganyctiphanes norvegica]
QQLRCGSDSAHCTRRTHYLLLRHSLRHTRATAALRRPPVQTPIRTTPFNITGAPGSQQTIAAHCVIMPYRQKPHVYHSDIVHAENCTNKCCGTQGTVAPACNSNSSSSSSNSNISSSRSSSSSDRTLCTPGGALLLLLQWPGATSPWPPTHQPTGHTPSPYGHTYPPADTVTGRMAHATDLSLEGYPMARWGSQN